MEKDMEKAITEDYCFYRILKPQNLELQRPSSCSRPSAGVSRSTGNIQSVEDGRAEETVHIEA